MSDPMHTMSQIRKKRYENEAKARKTHEGLLPWAQQIPWSVLTWTNLVLQVAGVVGAMAGLSAWAMTFPFAAALLQTSADLPRRRRACSFRSRLHSVVLAIAQISIGALIVHEAIAWLTAWPTLQVPMETIGWTVTVISAWMLSSNLIIMASLMMAPLPAEETKFPRCLYVELAPDVYNALHGIAGDQIKTRKNEIIGAAILFYADDLADRGLDRQPESESPPE